MIKQCTGIYVCPVAPTTKLSLIGNNMLSRRPLRLVIRATIWPLAAGGVLRPVPSLSRLFLRQTRPVRDLTDRELVCRRIVQ